MTREEILNAAKKCVCGGREEDYGKPEDSFGLIAELWTTYTRCDLTAKDVAVMMALLKIARIKTDVKSDSYVDLAGYAACAGELAGCNGGGGKHAPVAEEGVEKVKTLLDVAAERWPEYKATVTMFGCPHNFINGVVEQCSKMTCDKCWAEPWRDEYELRENV